MRKAYFIIYLQLTSFLLAQSQQDSLPILFDLPLETIEAFIENLEEETEFDYDSFLEQMESYLQHPLDLNSATEEELQELQVLNDRQINEFLFYRNQGGPLFNLYELQAIPNFDLATIKFMLPFVKVGSGVFDFRVGIPTMLINGKNELFMRWQRILETQRGFTSLEPGEDGSRYEGEPNAFYIRFKHKYENRLSYGITAENDAGEPFFEQNNKSGFDFYSAHFYLRDYRKWLKSFALGDFSLSMGQGLIQFSGFGSGKSSYTMDIKRNARPIKAYTSLNEADFMRGVGLTVSPSKNLEVTLAASSRNRDGNLFYLDTLDNGDPNILSFASLQNSGLHRTESEIAEKNSINHKALGGIIKYRKDASYIGVNVLHQKFDQSFDRIQFAYNKFRFSGDHLTNVSLDYALVARKFHFFGETGMSDNGVIASLNGLLLGLNPDLDFSLMYRYLPKDYENIQADVFAESSGGANEQGLYMGTEWRPDNHWKLNFYIDIWQHPWLRFNVDAPSRGNEFLGKISYKIKRKVELYLQYKVESKEKNAPENETKTDFLVFHTKRSIRLNASQNLSKALTLRNRIEWSFFDNTVESPTKGFMINQDILFKPIEFPLSFTCRLAYFDTEDFDSRIYAYENDLLNNFSIPAYSGRGFRYYLNLRYKPTRDLTLEFRAEQTRYTDRDIIGSGVSEIIGNARTKLKAQMKLQF